MAAMRKKQEKSKEWLAKGHGALLLRSYFGMPPSTFRANGRSVVVIAGQYEEIATEKDFFNTMKGEERMICHFYRENWPCKVCMRVTAMRWWQVFEVGSVCHEMRLQLL
jgi:hypothetical protein